MEDDLSMSARRQVCEQYAEPSVCLSQARQKSVHHEKSMVISIVTNCGVVRESEGKDS